MGRSIKVPIQNMQWLDMLKVLRNLIQRIQYEMCIGYGYQWYQIRWKNNWIQFEVNFSAFNVYPVNVKIRCIATSLQNAMLVGYTKTS